MSQVLHVDGLRIHCKTTVLRIHCQTLPMELQPLRTLKNHTPSPRNYSGFYECFSIDGSRIYCQNIAKLKTLPMHPQTLRNYKNHLPRPRE